MTDDVATRQSENLARVTDKIFAASQPGVVFGQPVVSGAVTVITASEVSSGGGFGTAAGLNRASSDPRREGQGADEGTASTPGGIGGSGMGGGGGAMARPVAAIIVGPDGVRVEPIFDLTKVALAGLAAVGTIVAIRFRSRRAR